MNRERQPQRFINVQLVPAYNRLRSPEDKKRFLRLLSLQVHPDKCSWYDFSKNPPEPLYNRLEELWPGVAGVADEYPLYPQMCNCAFNWVTETTANAQQGKPPPSNFSCGV